MEFCLLEDDAEWQYECFMVWHGVVDLSWCGVGEGGIYIKMETSVQNFFYLFFF